MAGFLYGWRLHGTAEGGLRWGVAAGSATAFRQGIATGEEVKGLFPQVGIPMWYRAWGKSPEKGPLPRNFS